VNYNVLKAGKANISFDFKNRMEIQAAVVGLLIMVSQFSNPHIMTVRICFCFRNEGREHDRWANEEIE